MGLRDLPKIGKTTSEKTRFPELRLLFWQKSKKISYVKKYLKVITISLREHQTAVFHQIKFQRVKSPILDAPNDDY